MKTPTYAVIKVNSAGEAKITKQWAETCVSSVLAGSESWRRERRNARIAGMRYFRLQCLSTDDDAWWVNPKHAVLNGVTFHINEFFSCRCCFPEWLFSDCDISRAIEEVSERKNNNP